MHRNSSQGFTLVELMIVVALVGIISALALVSFEKNRRLNVVDTWTRTNMDAINTAARRAIATRNPYMVVFSPTTVQWCQVALFSPPSQTCPALPAAASTTTQTFEIGKLVNEGFGDALTSFYANAPDIVNAVGYAPPPKTAVSGNVVLYFGRNGAASTSFTNVMSAGIANPSQLGFTLYTRRNIVDDPDYRRRLLVYGLTGKTRIIEDR